MCIKVVQERVERNKSIRNTTPNITYIILNLIFDQ